VLNSAQQHENIASSILSTFQLGYSYLCWWTLCQMVGIVKRCLNLGFSGGMRPCNSTAGCSSTSDNTPVWCSQSVGVVRFRNERTKGGRIRIGGFAGCDNTGLRRSGQRCRFPTKERSLAKYRMIDAVSVTLLQERERDPKWKDGLRERREGERVTAMNDEPASSSQ